MTQMDPKERFYELLESDQKDPEIQYQLGLCLLHGDGVAQDGIEGEKWLHRAARQGHPQAQAMLEAGADRIGASALVALYRQEG